MVGRGDIYTKSNTSFFTDSFAFLHQHFCQSVKKQKFGVNVYLGKIGEIGCISFLENY